MSRLFAFACLTGLVCAQAASAATVDWNTWSSNGDGSLTTPTGAVAVTFATDSTHFNCVGCMSWAPSTTYADGNTVANAPVDANSVMALFGGNSNANTLSFSTAVVNPVISLYSLGDGSSITASFVFNQTPTLVVGGPDSAYGGTAPTVVGNTVSGLNANGTIQFIGTFTQISWINPTYEYWYGFNVGVPELAAAAVPEPRQWALMLAGLAGVASIVRRRRG